MSTCLKEKIKKNSCAFSPKCGPLGEGCENFCLSSILSKGQIKIVMERKWHEGWQHRP